MIRLALPLPLVLSALWALPAMAQDMTVIQAENVRFAYAQVLRVTPVFQTLTATGIEQRCNQSPRAKDESSRRSLARGFRFAADSTSLSETLTSIRPRLISSHPRRK